MKFLSILFCAMSATAFAQQQNNHALYAKMTQRMRPQSRLLLDKQMAVAHGQNKTTGNKQRLVGYSTYDMQGSIDSNYFGYSGLRGTSYANCYENIQGGGGTFSKPDTIFTFSSGALSADVRFTYDGHDSVLSEYNAMLHYRAVYTLDNAGNTIISDYYDSSAGQTHTTLYSFFDNQNRRILDSMEQMGKIVYGYGQGIDSSINYSWDVNSATWSLSNKNVNIYNNAGMLSSFYQYQYDPSTSTWFPGYRTNYTFNSNGFVTSALWDVYDQGSSSWSSDYRETYDYTGNHPLFTSYEAEYYDPNAAGWLGDTKFTCQQNAAGNWDTVYLFQWNSSSNNWDAAQRVDFAYNSFDYVTKLGYHDYDVNTGGFDPNPSGREYYYYKTYYVPDAVTTVQSMSPEITAYPNPVSGKLHIDGNIGSRNVTLQMISITGVRLVSTSGNWQSIGKDIDMSAYPGGVYYLLIADEQGNKIAAKQIVKN